MDTNQAHIEALAASVGGRDALGRFFSWRTFSDLGKRAQRELEDGAGMLQAGKEAIAKALIDRDAPELIAELQEKFEARFIKAWAAYQFAGSRIASPMITGPAKFPVERNRRACATQDRRLGELMNVYNGAQAYAKTIAHRMNKAAAIAAKIEQGELQRTPDKEVAGVRIVENLEADRLQLIFPDRPDDEMRARLKGRGFKWSPRFGAWQRQLTDNARAAAQRILATA